MKNPTRIFLLIALLVASLSACRAQHQATPDSLPACVLRDSACLQIMGDSSAMHTFYNKVREMQAGKRRNVNLWHVGGSHVQAGVFSHRMRTLLSTMTGMPRAKRGILFPFGMAKTNYDKNYTIEHVGNWSTWRNLSKQPDGPLGITGIAARTSDSIASITLRLNARSRKPEWQFDRLHIIGYDSAGGVRPYILHEGERRYAARHAESSTYTFYYNELRDTATVYFDIPKGEEFTLTGIVPDNDLPGFCYYASGINGAAVPSWLRCEDLERDLRIVAPDLVIFAIGINDAHMPADKFEPEAFKNNYRKLMALIRRVSPDCAFLFITNNDSYHKGRPNRNALRVREVFRQLATESNGCVWDMFAVMGGLSGSTKWRNAGLMAKDRVHFSPEGYRLNGDMLFDALMQPLHSSSPTSTEAESYPAE